MKVLIVITVALLFVISTAALAPLLHTDNPNVIHGSYIVVLKDGLSVHDRDDHIIALEEFLNNIGTQNSGVVHRYNFGSWVGFSARLPKLVLLQQLQHPNVKYIEADQVMSISQQNTIDSPSSLITQTGATWGLDRVDQRDLPLDTLYIYNSLAGSGVDIYVLDTGIYANHTDFGGRVQPAFNAISNEANTDLNGHGTHCSGTAAGTKYGVAKLATLKSVKVLSASGSGSNAGVIAGIDYVTNNKNASRKSVASMSLGGGASTAMDDAVTSSIASGVVYAVAVGGSNTNACNSSPSRVPGVLAVGATTNTDARASFSDYGPCLSIFAPGSSITSDWIGSTTATNTLSGTSMSTPHVAGAVALAWSQNLALTGPQVRNLVLAVASQNKVTNPGANTTNLLLYTNPTA